MPSEREQLKIAIAALESQRSALGDAVIDAALAPLRAQLLGGPGAGPPTQSLKQVTILFLDVVGSTSLAQHLDAEDMHAVLDELLREGAAIVQANCGKVLQYAGDSLLAVFGADASREDDAERAVQAGLALLELGRRSGEQVERRYRHSGVNVRVGTHTGKVLLGGGVDTEHSIRGNAVHLAARMEQTAPPGGLRISHDTYRQVRGVFDVDEQPAMVLKGVDEPVITYLVQRAKPRAFRVVTRGIEGVETRMIGRAEELGRLQQAFRRVCSERTMVHLTVMADAGLGKSRLLYEFENWAEARPEAFYLFKGRANPQTRSQPYGLLRDVLSWRLQLSEGDSPELGKQKFEQGLAQLIGSGVSAEDSLGDVPALGCLIGLDYSGSPHIKAFDADPRELRRLGFHAAAQVFRRIAAKTATPVLLLLDDLHYADDSSLDFLDHLIQENRDVPMLLLGAGRPELFERHGSGVASPAPRIVVGPLDTAASQLLVDELLQKFDQIPPALHQLIASAAQGNPFYMEEMIKMLIDEGAIRTDPDRWHLDASKLIGARIPNTLTGVLQARLDGLEPAHKRALQQASVIGFQFWDRALAELDAHAVDSLATLTRRELIVAHTEAGPVGARQFTFKHQLLHQVTYETVLKSERRMLHGRVADWMAGVTGPTEGELLGTIAVHYEHAGNSVQAIEFFARAAENAASRFAHEAVKNSVARATTLLDEGAPPGQSAPTGDLRVRWRLLDVRERTLEMQGLRGEQQFDVSALEGLAEAMNDDRLRAEAAWRRCDVALRLADYPTQQVAARAAMLFARRVGDERLALRANQRLILALGYQGDTDAGKALGIDGLAAARALGDAYLESLHLSALSMIAVLQDDLPLALDLDAQTLLAARRAGDRRGESLAALSLANSCLGLGANSRAEQLVDEAWERIRSLGDRGAVAYLLNYKSLLAQRRGDAAAAQQHANDALQVALDIRDRQSEAYSLVRLGEAELDRHDHEAATSAFTRARETAAAIGSTLELDARGGLVRAALAHGEVTIARQMVDELLAHKTASGSFEGTEAPFLISWGCWQVLESVDDARAPAFLDATYQDLQAKAEILSDGALREGFLRGIPEHRDIAAAWSAQRASLGRTPNEGGEPPNSEAGGPGSEGAP